MKKLIIHFVLALGIVGASQAQTTNTPNTYFEVYNSVSDAVLLKGSTSIGMLNNQIHFPVEVRAERLMNLQTTNTLYAVSLRTRVARQQMQVDYIDYDELDGLIRGIQLISQAGHASVPMDNFEAVFRTRGGLSILKVSNGDKITILMKHSDPGEGVNELAPFVLDDLGRYLTAAKSKIDSIAASGQ
jgi:hypothetical protein